MAVKDKEGVILMNNGNKKTVLLVEDEVIIAMMEKMEMEKYGYIVHHVTTGENAVQTILKEDFKIDLILMDIDLGPGIDGTQAAAEILKHKDIPIVFLSSHTEPEVVEKTEKITSYGYVVKNSGETVLHLPRLTFLILIKKRPQHRRLPVFTSIFRKRNNCWDIRSWGARGTTIRKKKL